jgi:hypothetical protein
MNCFFTKVKSKHVLKTLDTVAVSVQMEFVCNKFKQELCFNAQKLCNNASIQKMGDKQNTYILQHLT